MIEALNTYRMTTKGLTTDFLNHMTSGLQKTDLVVIPGGISTGNTALAHNIALFSSKENKIPIVHFSLETPKHELLLRILSSETKVDLAQISKRFLSAEDWTILREATGKSQGLNYVS